MDENLADILRAEDGWSGIYVKGGVGATYRGRAHFCARMPLVEAARALAVIGPREHMESAEGSPPAAQQVSPADEAGASADEAGAPVYAGDELEELLMEDDAPDFGAEMLAAEGEAEQDSEHEMDELAVGGTDWPSDGDRRSEPSGLHGPLVAEREEAVEVGSGGSDGLHESDESGDASGALYPGIAILPDELGARRAAVVTGITYAELDRVAAATDPGLWLTLTQAMSDYNNGDRRELTVANAMAFMEAEARDKRIRDHADALRRAAMTADLDTLAAMAAGLEEGWP